MKRLDRAQIKDTAIPTQLNYVSRRANVKIDTENMSRKNLTKGLKGATTKYGQQNDLREQNHLLMTANEDLQKQISEMKECVADLEQRCRDLQDENSEIKKQLRDCHALLILEKLDPVSGEKIGETEQKEAQRKEIMTVSQNLMTELKHFDEVARQHGTHLTELQNTMRTLKEAREKFHLDGESFCLDVEEMEKALEEAEKLLIE
ncbi:small kinetochore-associated protein [Electrophorus electricus]|uniref:Kinetochore localized astrin (SPAG5) binding protein n=1 Tax=Electrophorus electricus TaxID=8005 RepID=A0A4W4FLG1_ELEEL|nr:small kinetochore-associated protein [Electrophorus electricus]